MDTKHYRNLENLSPTLPLTQHLWEVSVNFGWGGASGQFSRFVKSSQLPKIATYLGRIGRLLCLAFLYGWRFLNKISLDWLLTLTTRPSTSKLSDNPENAHVETDSLLFKSFSNYWTVFHYITQDSKVGCSLHRLPFGPCRDITSFYTKLLLAQNKSLDP